MNDSVTRFYSGIFDWDRTDRPPTEKMASAAVVARILRYLVEGMQHSAENGLLPTDEDDEILSACVAYLDYLTDEFLPRGKGEGGRS